VTTGAEPRSRRDRPAKAALTRAGIVAAAVAVMKSQGLERVTLRRLAQELDTGPASLYVYFRNGAALHAAILDELLGSVPLPARDAAGGWAGRITDALWSYSGMLLEHPSLARSAVVARPSGPHYLAIVDYLLQQLADGGVPAGQRALGVDLLLLFATTQAAEHAGRGRSQAGREDHELALALRNAPPAQYPAIAATGANLIMDGAPRDRYAWFARALVAGIAATPWPSAGG
jgi:AcrR family transcriptional regulator